jgi:formate dehydrogenase subunit gamma
MGMEGAFEGMGSGTVDANWAMEHHKLWYEEAMGRSGAGKMPPRSAAVPAE